MNFWSVTFVTASDVLNILLVKYFNFYMQFSRCKPKEPERSFRCRNCSDLVACAPRSEDSFSCCRSLRDLQRGDKGIRTLDPLLARQVLSQLSYTPMGVGAHLLSHTVSSIVSSAAQVLTIVFGMGTGVTPGRISTNNFESLMTQQ